MLYTEQWYRVLNAVNDIVGLLLLFFTGIFVAWSGWLRYSWWLTFVPWALFLITILLWFYRRNYIKRRDRWTLKFYRSGINYTLIMTNQEEYQWALQTYIVDARDPAKNTDDDDKELVQVGD